jgi:glycylpeptide N-tetradecanoyltransferase
LPEETKLEGLRIMCPADVPAVSVLLNQHLQKEYKVHINFSDDEVAHWLLPREGVIKSWIVEQKDGSITDLASFYELDSHVLNHSVHTRLNIAYAMYCVADQNSTERYKLLFKDLLIMAKNEKFDVFNLTEVMQHKKVLEDLMFRVGDGHLKHYFYNWNLSSTKPEEIGIIML